MAAAAPNATLTGTTPETMNERDELRNYWIVQGKLHLLEGKRRCGIYPYTLAELRALEGQTPPRKGPPILRVCQHCNDVIRTWNVHPDVPVSCNLCEIAPKWREL